MRIMIMLTPARLARTRLYLSAALLSGLVACGFSSAASAQAADDDDDLTFEQKIITNLLQGLGVDTGKGRIEYRERSPLVIPPSRELPAPEDVAVAKDPTWPKDPEIKVRKKTSSKPRPKTITELEDPGRPLRPHELEQGRVAGAGRVTNPGQAGPTPEQEMGKPVKPSELGFTGSLWSSVFGYKEEEAKFEGEAPRASLTEPPAGYRTPSGAQPYGVNTKKRNTSTLEMDAVKDPRAK